VSRFDVTYDSLILKKSLEKKIPQNDLWHVRRC